MKRIISSGVALLLVLMMASALTFCEKHNDEQGIIKPDLKAKPLPVVKVDTISLWAALPTLSGIRLPVLTQAQINALVPVKGLLLWNDTEGVLQIYNGTKWLVYPTTN